MNQETKVPTSGPTISKAGFDVSPLGEYFEAETYHRDYARQHPNQPYIAGVSTPKVRKLAKYFPEKLKKS